MKAKVSRGGGFRGALNYVFDVGKEATHTKNAERVGGNMAGNDPRELSREFSAVRQLRPEIGKPVWHCSLSLPPGERLSAEKWEAVTATSCSAWALTRPIRRGWQCATRTRTRITSTSWQAG